MKNETKLCKYCQTEIPMKAKVCPNCRRKQGGIAKWIIIMLVAFLFIGFINNSNEKEETSKNKKSEIKTVNNKKESDNVSDEDFAKKEYLYENTIGDSLYFVVITNNSNTNISVSANATAKDVNGNPIGADNMTIDIIGAGETAIGYFYFDSVTGIDKVEYKTTYNKNVYYSPVVNNLSVEQTINDKNVILQVTNNGEKEAKFVEAYVLFMDSENNVIRYDSTYIIDNDSEIKPNETVSVQLDSYKEYDHVEIYFTGRANK